jgi:hypothetical protein
MQSLAVSCTPDGANTGVWHYSGGITLTVPDDAPSSLSVSVAVEELIPMAALGATATYDYNFNRTYTVVRPITTSMTTGAGTTTAGSTTVAAPARTATSSTTTRTQTTATPAGTATSAATTTLTARKLVLHAPSTITIERPRAFVTILVTSNDRRSRQTLCWRHPPETRFACADGRGEWHARLRGSLGKEIFVLKIDGRVVAQASATFKLKR